MLIVVRKRLKIKQIKKIWYIKGKKIEDIPRFDILSVRK